jgi:hypothetical protein
MPLGFFAMVFFIWAAALGLRRKGWDVRPRVHQLQEPSRTASLAAPAHARRHAPSRELSK